jgi:phosphate-selective porin OprO and OprP
LTQESRIFEPFGQHGAQFGRNRPQRNFKFSQAGSSPGAWELKARWSNLDLDNIRSGQYNDVTAGVNWYWSDRTRWMFDWIHPITTPDAVVGETKSDLLALRLDFNW